jgi:putative membrane protein
MGTVTTGEDGGGWHRLHPLSPAVRAGRRLVTIVIALAVLFIANQHQEGSDLIGDIVVFGVVLVGGVISWLVTRWQVADGMLRIDTGLIRRQNLRFPLSQVQAIDVVQTGLGRVLGLAELRLRMAGGDSSGGRLACLRLTEAEQLRQRLLAMTASAPSSSTAPAAAGAAPAVQDGGRELFRVRPVRLAVGIVLSRAGAIAAIVIAVMASIAAVTGQPGVLAGYLPIGLAIVLAVWRQFNGEYGTAVAVAADGLRLRSGLVQTTAETIRPGRVQAVRLVEPLAWRAFGWCRLEVDIAGPKQRHEDRSESQRLRALIPVGSRAEAEHVLGELLTGRPVPSRRAPGAARWKAPLTFHFLAWGGDERYVAASRGRVSRKTTWVPLEKVQSVRWVQGPVQRRLGLASVRLDVAGRRVTGDIEDRPVAEADELLRRLPALARAARARTAPSQ